MGTNCAPLVADLFLFCYERESSKAILRLWIFYVFFCLVFVMPLYASDYLCLVVTC